VSELWPAAPNEDPGYNISGGPPPIKAEQLRVLKSGDLFAVFDLKGDFSGTLHAVGPSVGADGLFQDDTRVLSKFVLTLDGHPSQHLSDHISPDNVLFTAHLTNQEFRDQSHRLIRPGLVHILRKRFLWQRKLYETISIRSFGLERATFALEFELDADFRDVFEIRGMTRAHRGQLLQPNKKSDGLRFIYQGLDGHIRVTAINFSAPIAFHDRRIGIPLDLGRGEDHRLSVTIASDGDTTLPDPGSFFATLRKAKRATRRHIRRLNCIGTSNSCLNSWIERAAADLALLLTNLDTGPYPYAGIPWFSVPFGRDAIITALQTLWLDPTIARGVLSFLRVNQASDRSDFHSSEPGKILHETRKGEMAALLEVPFGRYYGGVDTTPLFIILAGEYLRRTNDVAFCAELWPSICAALNWIRDCGDVDGDGFVEYRCEEPGGLRNQGWKDSEDSIFHSDGRLADSPIALIEVQAYVANAKRSAATIAASLGEMGVASQLQAEADRLTMAINAVFWSEDLNTYVLALDRHKQPCAIRASNAGHALFCGVADSDKAAKLAATLFDNRIFSGWGTRTVATEAPLYNPISYHNGTVWPHDCSIIAAGLSRYGMTGAAARLFEGLYHAACHFSDYRLPELFCGFPRRASEGPVAYPSACTPQAWASGSLFLLLQAVLGLDIDARCSKVIVRRPTLPHWLEEVTVRGVSVGRARTSLRFRRDTTGVSVSLSDVEGSVVLERL
jgi:glycogen debranching enzyme